jgi:hypothetical protein
MSGDASHHQMPAAPEELADLATLVAEDRILQAVVLLRQRLDELGGSQSGDEHSSGDNAAAEDALGMSGGESGSGSHALRNDPFVCVVLRDGAEAEEVLALLSDESELKQQTTDGGDNGGDKNSLTGGNDDVPWSLVRDSDETRTWVRREEGANMNSLKMRGEVKSPLLNLVALLLETDLYHHWMTKELKAVELIAQLTMFKRITYFRGGFGWGVWDRDIYLHTFGVDLAPRRAVLVVVNECDEARASNYGVTLPVVPERTVRIRGKPGGMLIEYVGENETKLTILSRSDPQLNAAAYWVLDLIQKHVSHAVITKLGRLSRDLEGTPYETRLQEDRDGVYHTIRERLDAMLQDDRSPGDEEIDSPEDR